MARTPTKRVEGRKKGTATIKRGEKPKKRAHLKDREKLPVSKTVGPNGAK